MNLPRLSGYLKFPDGFPAAPIKLTPVSRKRRAKPFIKRADDRPGKGGSAPSPLPPKAPRPDSSGGTTHPSSNDDGAGKPVAPKQSELVLGGEAGHPDRKPKGRDRDDNPNKAEKMRNQLAVGGSLGPKNILPSAAMPDESAAPDTQGARPSMPMASVLRTGGSEAEQPLPTNQDAEQRTGIASDQKSAGERSAKQPGEELRRGNDARKLMLEDGMNEREAVDLGDVDMDM